MTVDLTAPEFHDEAKAREWLEQSRWPNGVNCPHCGSLGVIRLGYDVPKAGAKGKAHRPGLFHCRDCRGQFTVCTGHVMESSHVKLTKWVLAMRLLASSKKGMSAHQLHRSIKVTYKTAWFMFHRLREGVSATNAAPVGGEDKIVEADEAYFGKRKTPAQRSRNARQTFTKAGKSGGAQKRPIVALVERGGEVRAKHMVTVNARNLGQFIVANADAKSRFMTDESQLYAGMDKQFVSHETVTHSKGEYARGDVTTNTVEGFFGVFKRGITGVYQHCAEHHFQRYIDEFSFRYNNRSKLGVEDSERAVKIAKAGEGKRLTYRRVAGPGNGVEG